MMPWDYSVPEDEQNPYLAEELGAEEAKSAILNSLLEMLPVYRAERLKNIPQCVKDATAAYIRTNDRMLQFIDEHAKRVPGHSGTPASMAFMVWERFCRENRYEPGSTVTFAKRMKEKGFTSKRTNRGNVYPEFVLRLDETAGPDEAAGEIIPLPTGTV